MNRGLGIAAGVAGGAALLGVGLAIGSQMGQRDALIAAAEVQGPLSTNDSLLMQTFLQASTNFDQLVHRAQTAKDVNAQRLGVAMTTQGVIVMRVERNAEGPELRAAADAVSQAMVLIGAGVTANDGGSVQEGLDQYQVGSQRVTELVNKINGTPSDAPSEPASPEPSPSQ